MKILAQDYSTHSLIKDIYGAKYPLIIGYALKKSAKLGSEAFKIWWVVLSQQPSFHACPINCVP
jgi:hypothetical protein